MFGNGGYLRRYETWHYQGVNNKVVNIYKYMYIAAYFTPNFRWSRTPDIVSKQRNKAIAQIYTVQKKFGYFQHKGAF